MTLEYTSMQNRAQNQHVPPLWNKKISSQKHNLSAQRAHRIDKVYSEWEELYLHFFLFTIQIQRCTPKFNKRIKCNHQTESWALTGAATRADHRHDEPQRDYRAQRLKNLPIFVQISYAPSSEGFYVFS